MFRAEDILNLEVGQAIARVGGSSAAFNLSTFKEPGPPADDPTQTDCRLSQTAIRQATPGSRAGTDACD